MDLSDDPREPSYGTSRFQGSGQPGPKLIRMLDGHIQPYKVEREVDYDAELDLANVYDCEDY